MPQTFGQLAIATDLVALPGDTRDRELLRQVTVGLQVAICGRLRDARNILETNPISVVLLRPGSSDGTPTEALVADIANRAPGMVVLVLAVSEEAGDGDLMALAKYGVSEMITERDPAVIKARVSAVVEAARFRARLRRRADELADRFDGVAAAIVRDAVSRGDVDRSVKDFANGLGLSIRDLERIAERDIGLVPMALLGWGRLIAAMTMLESTLLTCERVANDLGFASSSAFSSQMRRYAGAPPDRMRRGGGTQWLAARFRDAIRDKASRA